MEEAACKQAYNGGFGHMLVGRFYTVKSRCPEKKLSAVMPLPP